jgi:hypothetical protein
MKASSALGISDHLLLAIDCNGGDVGRRSAPSNGLSIRNRYSVGNRLRCRRRGGLVARERLVFLE